MYLKTGRRGGGNNLKHKFLSGSGRVIWWMRDESIEGFIRYMTIKNYIERIVL
jgi:hypothetical protein